MTAHIAYRLGEHWKHACDHQERGGDRPGRVGNDVIRLGIDRERLGDVRYCSSGNT
jgi:hypothetical protein